MLELRHISKSFAGLRALTDVSLAVRPGSIHGLLGENGAGKSTLMNILFGLLQPDSGEILISGERVRLHSPAQAQGLGIGMVHQHFKLVPTLTVLENFALTLHRKWGWLPRTALKSKLAHWCGSLGWQLDPDARVSSLSVGLQQRLEIIKAIAVDSKSDASRVLILDEPTAVLTPQEVSDLFRAIRKLADSGVAVILISHKLAEVTSICEHVTILRRGKCIHSAPTSSLTAGDITRHMVGADVPVLERTPPTKHADTRPILSLQRLSGGLLQDATLELFPGEILGIAGVDGNGQTDLVQAIIGGRRVESGTLVAAGADLTHASIASRLRHIAYIPEDRQRQALQLPLTVAENLMLKAYRRPPFARCGLLSLRHWQGRAEDLIRRFDIRTPSATVSAASLSGGNQQKIVLAREFSENRSIVVAANPTRGLDVGATHFVLNQLLHARDGGAGVLLVHSDLDELLAVADRVLVLYRGRLMQADWPSASKEQIGRLMMGVHATETAA